MPVVQVKGVGRVRFPDEMSKEEIKDVLVRKFGSGRETKGFWESFGKSADQTSEDYAIGKLALENDKEFTIDLLENEFVDWQQKASPAESPPPFWTRENWGEMVGGVQRDVILGATTAIGGSVVSTPIGGIAASGAVVTTLQSITAKGGSFRDAYNQIRHKQKQQGFDDKDAAYETARKISNNDAWIAAMESGLSTLLPIKGIGGPLKKAITKPILDTAFDATVGGVGSVASDIQAEAIGGEQGIERGDLWDNAIRAATQEAAIGGPSNGFSTVRGINNYRKVVKRGKNIQKLRNDRIAQEKATNELRSLAQADAASGDAVTAQLRRAALQQQAVEQRAEQVRRAQDREHGTSTMEAIRGEESAKREARGEPVLIEVPKEPEGLTEQERLTYHPTVIQPDEAGKKPGRTRTQGATKNERAAARRKSSKEPTPDSRLVVPLGVSNIPDMGMGTKVENPNVQPILDHRGNVLFNVDKVAMPEQSVTQQDVGPEGRRQQVQQQQGRTKPSTAAVRDSKGQFRPPVASAATRPIPTEPARAPGLHQAEQLRLGQRDHIRTTMDSNSDRIRNIKDAKTPESRAEMEQLSDENGRLQSRLMEMAIQDIERGIVEKGKPPKQATGFDLFKNEVLAPLKDLGDLSKMGMGVDPTPVWQAMKGLMKVAAYYRGRGVTSAKEFARKAGLKLGPAVRKAWEAAKRMIPFRPSEMGRNVLGDLGGVDQTNTAEGQEASTIKEWYGEKRDKYTRRFADRFIDLLRLQEKFAKGEPLPDTNNAYQAEQLMHGRLGKLLTAFNAEVDALMQRIQTLDITLANVEQFLYALHAQERNAHIAEINPKFPDGGSGMTNERAAQILKKAEESGEIEAFKEIANKLKEINDRTLDVQLEGGLITADEHAQLKGFYKNYMPLMGHEESDPRVRETGNHVSINNDFRNKENAFALGHGEKSTNLLAHAFEKHANAVARAERNRVYQTFLNWANSNPDNGVVAIAEPTLKRQFNHRTKQVEDVPDSNWTNQPDVLALKVDGEFQYLRVTNLDLARNLKLMGTGSLPSGFQSIAQFQRWLAMANTTLNPDFILPNFIRDVATAGVNLSTEETASLLKGLNPKTMYKLGKTIWSAERGGKLDSEIAALYELFRENGGKMEFAQMVNLDAQVRNIEKYATQSKGVRGAAKAVAQQKLVKGTLDVMQQANAVAENTTRLAVFKAAMDSGKFTPKQAAFLARNITVNFTKKGELGTIINTLYLFYNASIQGSLRIFQAAKSKRVQKILGGVMTLGATENVLNQMFGGEEDEDGFTPYDKIPEYIKQSNMIIPLPYTDKVLTIPLPYGYNTVYYAGKQITSLMPGVGGKKTVGDAASDLFNTALSSFNPIGGSQNIWRGIMPEIIKPFVDLSKNEDWKGDTIMPERNPFEKYDIPKSQRYWNTATGWSKSAARKLNELAGGNEHESSYLDVSPEELDYAVAYLTGGLGKTISRVVEGGGKVLSGEWDRLRIEDVPIVRRFQEDPSPYFEIQEYKGLRKEVNRAVERMKFLRKAKNRKDIEEHRTEKRSLLQMNSQIKRTDTTMSNINQAQKKIRANSRMNSAKKSKELQKLADRKRLVLRKTIRRFVDLENK